MQLGHHRCWPHGLTFKPYTRSSGIEQSKRKRQAALLLSNGEAAMSPTRSPLRPAVVQGNDPKDALCFFSLSMQLEAEQTLDPLMLLDLQVAPSTARSSLKRTCMLS